MYIEEGLIQLFMGVFCLGNKQLITLKKYANNHPNGPLTMTGINMYPLQMEVSYGGTVMRDSYTKGS